MSHEEEPKKNFSEAEMRQQMISKELDYLIEKMMETEDMAEEEEVEPESLEALKKAANNLCYLRKYYDVSNDKIIYFPSLIKTIINYSLLEEAEKFYFEEEDEFPSDYSIALRSVAFEKEEAEGDEGDNGMDDELMERLSMSVQLEESDQEDLKAADDEKLLPAEEKDEGDEKVLPMEEKEEKDEESEQDLVVEEKDEDSSADEDAGKSDASEKENDGDDQEKQDIEEEVPGKGEQLEEPQDDAILTSESEEKQEVLENDETEQQDEEILTTATGPEVNAESRTPSMSTMALCSAVFVMYYTVFSVLPYAGYMVMHLVPGIHDRDVGPYVGFLASSFLVGRALSSYVWGRLADIYGRKFVLIASLVASAFFSLLFGCSVTFAMAVVMRFFMGKLKDGTTTCCASGCLVARFLSSYGDPNRAWQRCDRSSKDLRF
eukprot:scaffold8505_cov130-Cylindrotheca_fusiformis.AAC.5